jgi:hypothetical protein
MFLPVIDELLREVEFYTPLAWFPSGWMKFSEEVPFFGSSRDKLRVVNAFWTFNPSLIWTVLAVVT